MINRSHTLEIDIRQQLPVIHAHFTLSILVLKETLVANGKAAEIFRPPDNEIQSDI